MLQLLAACLFFTRLPFWRLVEVPSSCFKRVVPYWPLTGWLTAGLSVLVWYLSSLIVPTGIALVFAILTRLFVTGCLHEDGLADFIDGFGGGNSRESILTIMKDSHIGTYGVIGLIGYFTLFYALLASLPLEIAGTIWLVGDPLAKSIAAMTINRLPYAKKETEAKNQVVYTRMTPRICDLYIRRTITRMLVTFLSVCRSRFVSCWYLVCINRIHKKKDTGLYGRLLRSGFPVVRTKFLPGSRYFV